MIASKPSFSYTNEHATRERFVLKIKRNKVEDDELGVFGAEKYFKGVIDEERLRTSGNSAQCGRNLPQEKHEEPCPTPKPKTLSSIRSESSWNSRRGLLVGNGHNGNNHSKKTSVKSLFASLGCNCSDKGSVKVMEAKQPVKGMSLSNKRADEDVIKREDCFTFPVLNPSMADVKRTELPEVKQGGKKSIIPERKLTMSNWDGATPRAQIPDTSSNGGQDDTGSDGSSDLFELESLSTNENNLFPAQLEIENSGYEASEASIGWSVVTASVADFSTRGDLVVSRNVKGSGVLSGCKGLKAVRTSGDEHRTISDGRKAAVIASSARREWCNQLDSTTPVAKIQADTKLLCAGSGLHISRNGFGVTRQVHSTHSTHASSHHLYMQQQ